MSDTAIGFALVGIGMLVVLGVVFVVFSRGGPAEPRPIPPRGVHLPQPSFLPVVLSLGGRADRRRTGVPRRRPARQPVPGHPRPLVFVLGAIWWVRAANHEWHDTEHGSHGDDAPH